MLVLNLLNRMFGRNSKLTRSDVDRHHSDKSARHEVEEQAANDPFDDDALEGFSEQNLSTDAMTNLDKRMVKSLAPNKRYYTLAATLALFIIVGASLLLFLDQPQKVQMASVEKEDKKEPEKDQMNEKLEDEKVQPVAPEEITDKTEEKTVASAPEQVQEEVIAPETLEEDIIVSEDAMVAESEPEFQFNQRALSGVAPTPRKNMAKTAALHYQSAKEMYIYDFKLIDYRAYRDAPQQEDTPLTGTAAEFQSAEVETESPVVWNEQKVYYVDYLETAMNYVKNEQFNRAIQGFNEILSHYPDDVNAHFYKAWCLFQQGNYENSRSHFKRAYTVKFGNFKEEATWHIGLCFEAEGNEEKAQEVFQKIANKGGFYHKQAKEKLK